MNLPIAQEDTSPGTVFGIKGRFPLTSFIGVEPNFTYLKNGDGEVEIDHPNWDRTMKAEGGKFSSFGVDLVVGSVLGYKGLGVHGILGFSSAKFKKEGVTDLTKGSYWLGLGFEYAFSDQLSLEFRGKAIIFPYDDATNTLNTDTKGSRKNGLITAGLNYYFGSTE